jgi:anaerobic ribonucleoside-triphosphate reductase
MENEKKLEKLNEQIAQVEGKLNDPHLCEGTSDILTRVSGYYRSVSAFNDGKAAEYSERQEYKIA